MPPANRFASPTEQLVALEGFIARPGYACEVGELVEVPRSAVLMLIASGKARKPTDEELGAANEPPPRDPQSKTADKSDRSKR